MNIAILGAGAWGTALAVALARRHPVRLWARDSGQCAAMRASRENVRYLPGVRLPEAIALSDGLAAALDRAELVLVATPLSGFRQTVRLAAGSHPGLPLLWLCKGLESGSGLLPHQVVAAEAPGTLCGALTGPSFAEEVADGRPTALSLAAAEAGFARRTAQALNDTRLRIYANDDVIGAEVAGAVKNVLAIATGISDGLDLGLNSRAALMTRGLAEITRFGLALGARRETFMGLAGLGDLILTCTGDLSRNRRVGLALAAGRPLESITSELGHVAEGVTTAREVAARAAALGIDMPITDAVCAVLGGGLNPADAVGRLMGREPKAE